MQATHIPSADERSTYLATAVRAAEAAGTVLLNYAKSGFRIDYKAAINLVTDADRQAEDCIVRTILSAHPSHRILAEERGQDGSPDSPYQWIIDPLDGTTNFAHGFPFYAVSIGLEYHGECILGVVSDPVRRELFTGIVGEGAYLNGERLCVSPIDELERSLLVTGFAYNIRETADNNLDHFSRISLRAQAIRRTGSAALDPLLRGFGTIRRLLGSKTEPVGYGSRDRDGAGSRRRRVGIHHKPLLALWTGTRGHQRAASTGSSSTPSTSARTQAHPHSCTAASPA
ncbi:MAG: inositol monophosphatase [Nitrospira sp.]|nr:inositol monophosphatase [Nitrospira sp.]